MTTMEEDLNLLCQRARNEGATLVVGMENGEIISEVLTGSIVSQLGLIKLLDVRIVRAVSDIDHVEIETKRRAFTTD